MKLGSARPTYSKANQLTLDYGESTVLVCVWGGGQARRIVSSCLKDLNAGDFQKWVFKGNIRGEGFRVYDQLMDI